MEMALCELSAVTPVSREDGYPAGCKKEWECRSSAVMVTAKGTVCVAQQLNQSKA